MAAALQPAGSKQCHRAIVPTPLVKMINRLRTHLPNCQRSVLQEHEAVRNLAALSNADLQTMVELQDQLLAAQDTV